MNKKQLLLLTLGLLTGANSYGSGWFEASDSSDSETEAPAQEEASSAAGSSKETWRQFFTHIIFSYDLAPDFKPDFSNEDTLSGDVGTIKEKEKMDHSEFNKEWQKRRKPDHKREEYNWHWEDDLSDTEAEPTQPKDLE